MSKILFKGENVRYKSILRVDAFQIEEGKITCILGESGGGKTTFLKLLNKLISPTEGTLYFYDEPFNTLDTISHRKKVVLLSQNPFIFSSTILDNFKIAAQFHAISIDDETIKNSLKEVSLHKDLDTDVSKLSGGEAQRLALARVMVLKSDVILLDEPSSALDDETEQLVIDKVIHYVKENKKTLVMVTHSKQVAKKYADKTYLMEKGLLKEVS